MAIRNTSVLFGLFFMGLGSVYSGSAIGAEQAPAADPAGDAAAVEAVDDEGAAPAADAEVMPMTDEATEPELPEGQEVEVGSFGQIDLHVKDLELTKVLQLLSIQSQRNIVASRQVSGTISADLYDVGFYEALDAILHTNGFGYREQGNFIYVYTQEEIQQMEEAQREMATKVLRLNYITANDASEFVRPMLSSNGSISVSGEASPSMQPSLTDAGANSYAHSEMLVLRDYPDHIEQIEAVLEDLDQRPKQVQIEATVLDAKLTEANAFGVDFAIFSSLGVDDFATPLGSVDELMRGEVDGTGGSIVSSPADFPEGTGTSMKLGFMGSDAAVFVQALDSVTDTTVVARPQMLVLNRQRAELLVGRQLGYLSTTATDTTTTQTVEFLDIGTQLTVRPFVSDDGFVRLELRPEVSSGETNPEGDFIIPDKTTQELTTNVMVRSGQTVVLGGLFRESTQTGRNQVPGLGDVPLVGGLFQGRHDNVDRSEVIFLIKPTVIKDETLYADAEQARDTVDLARVGAREGLLPWSRTKLTNSHLQRAYKHKREGDKDKALWHTNMVLHLHPSKVEALRLKERLTGEQMMVKDHSMLRDAVDTMVDEQAPHDEAPAANEQDDNGIEDDGDADDGNESESEAEATSLENGDGAARDDVDSLMEEALEAEVGAETDAAADEDAEGSAESARRSRGDDRFDVLLNGVNGERSAEDE